jgi:hypothetical protein
MTTAVQSINHRRGALVLAAFIAQLGLPLTVLLKAPFDWGGCPRPVAMEEQADRFRLMVIGSDAVLFITVIAAVVWWTAGSRHQYRWQHMVMVLVPAVAIAGLTFALAAFATLSLCGANWLLP